MSEQSRGVSVEVVDVAELIEALAFLGDWLDGPDHDLLAASLRRFVGVHGYDLAALQSDLLTRFASLLGDDGERLFRPGQQ